MTFDNDGLGETLFRVDPYIGAGPGGFRATGQGMIRVMEQLEKQVVDMGTIIHYQTQVESVRRGDKGGWTVKTSSVSDKSAVSSKTCDKLVVATGAFNKASLPAFSLPFIHPFRTPVDSHDMTAPLAIHTSHLSDPTIQAALVSVRRKIVVVGASKSALDASERFSTLGHDVTLVFRNPPYLAPAALMLPSGPADAAAMVGTREKALGVPFPADVVSGQRASGGFWATAYRWLLHSSWLSSVMHPKLIARSVSGFARIGQWAHPSLRLMIPKIGLMWSEFSIFPGPEAYVKLVTGAYNDHRFANLVQDGKIKLVKGAVADMRKTEEAKEQGFKLSIRGENNNETELFATAVIYGSGWSTGEYPFFDRSLIESLGLPLPYQEGIPAREDEYLAMDRTMGQSMLQRLRTMRLMPSDWSIPGYSARFGGGKSPTWAPYRLYRLMVPLDSLYDRDIAFAGIPTCKANHVLFICQAHWIADYLLDLLPRLPSRALAKKEISTQIVWAQRLFGPSHGRLGQWLGAMWIEYCSRLCWDMGVEDDGKGWDGIVTSDSYDLSRKRAARDNGGSMRS
ncbi:hypothetical protein P7C73_g1991, partial [Tremellales sp. Uapishka_1]